MNLEVALVGLASIGVVGFMFSVICHRIDVGGKRK